MLKRRKAHSGGDKDTHKQSKSPLKRVHKATIDAASFTLQDEHARNDDELSRENTPSSDELTSVTPTQNRSQRRKPLAATTKANGTSIISTPISKRYARFETPSRAAVPTPSRRIAADRSARRKSVRAIIERIVAGDETDDNTGEDLLNREIYASSCSSEEEDVPDEDPSPTKRSAKRAAPVFEADGTRMAQAKTIAEEEGALSPVLAAQTPKRGRGRPKGTGKLQLARAEAEAAVATTKIGRSQTNLLDSPPLAKRESGFILAHEKYFLANRPGYTKTSNNTLASLELLTHEEYFAIVNRYSTDVQDCNNTIEQESPSSQRKKSKKQKKRKHQDEENEIKIHTSGSDGTSSIWKQKCHNEELHHLESIHEAAFPQWAFELSQGFSVCAYGYGSKRHLLNKFATYLWNTRQKSDGNTQLDASPAGRNKIVVVNGYVRTLSLRDILSTVCAAADPSGEHKIPASNPAIMFHALRELFLSPSFSHTITVIFHSIDAPGLRRPAVHQTLSSLAALPSINLICSADTPDFPLLWDSGLRASFNFLFHDATTFVPFTPPEVDPVDDVHELLGRKNRRVGGKDGVVFVLRSLPENAKNLFRILILEVLAALEEDGAGSGGDISAEGVGIEYRVLYRKAEEEFVCSNDIGFRTLLKE